MFVLRRRAISPLTCPTLSQQFTVLLSSKPHIFMHSFIHASVARIPFIHVCISTLCLISFAPHERVIPNVSDQKGLTNQVVFKWQVPPSNHFTKYSPIPFPTLSLIYFVKVYHIRLYLFKGNRQVFPCIFVFTNLKVIDMSLLAYLFSCIFVGYYFKSNRQDFFSCIFVGYYFKSNRQDFFFMHIRRLLFQK